MGTGICAPSPSNKDLLLCPSNEDPPLCLVSPLEHGGLCTCLFVVVLLGWLFPCPLDYLVPLRGAFFQLLYLGRALVGVLTLGASSPFSS